MSGITSPGDVAHGAGQLFDVQINQLPSVDSLAQHVAQRVESLLPLGFGALDVLS